MKKLYAILIAFTVFTSVQAQDQEPTIKLPKSPIGGRPNIPSDLSIEFGFSQLNNRPSELGLNFFSSRSFNVYYQYPIHISGENSGFVLKPGFGIGTDKWSFKDNNNLFNDPDLGPESSQLLPVTDVFGDNITVNKNTFAANYFEIPIDIVYHFNKSNYSKGFRMSLGGKIGFLYNSHSKIAYQDSDRLKRKIKDAQNYGLEKIRYGISFKAGSPGFYFWGYYGLNNAFQKGLGPFGTEASQFNFGVAVNVF